MKRAVVGGLIALSLAGCGGLKGDLAETLTISPTVAAINASATQNFTFEYSGPNVPDFIWSTNGGSITQGGQFTAPAGSAAYRVTLTSATRPTLTKTSTVLVGAGNNGTVNPAATTIGIGEIVPFTHVFTDVISQDATWFATAGQITLGGIFTAPSSAATVTVAAVSKENDSIFGSRQLEIKAISILVTPEGIQIVKSTDRQFTANVTNAFNTAVTWKATRGTISATGLYTAPATSGTDTITATSQANPTVFTSVLVSIID